MCENGLKRISEQELRKIQIEILDEVDNFCRNHAINYWIDCGTLLGAVRHKGYIPWDDDIDVGMLRDDYNRFAKEFNQKGKRYRFLCPEKDRDYCYAQGKVIDTNTVLYEPDETGRKLAVNIDIFVYDNAPNDEIKTKKMFDKRDFYRRLNVAHSQRCDIIGGKKRNLGFGILRIITMPFSHNFFALKMVENSQKYAAVDLDKIGDFTSYSRAVCEKAAFDSFLEMEFEHKNYKVPSGYDEWLRALYGNYMELPPIEKRVSTHKFKAYKIVQKGEGEN